MSPGTGTGALSDCIYLLSLSLFLTAIRWLIAVSFHFDTFSLFFFYTFTFDLGFRSDCLDRLALVDPCFMRHGTEFWLGHHFSSCLPGLLGL